MNRSTPPSKWSHKNPTTLQTTSGQDSKDENKSPSTPRHHLTSVVPPRTPKSPRPMSNQLHRQSSEEHYPFVPSLRTIKESSEEDRPESITKRFNDLVQEPCREAKLPSARALNILRYVAGGGDSFPAVSHPEVEAFASGLIELRDEERVALLEPLSNELQHHLSRKQAIKVSNALEYLRAAGTSIHDQSLINSRLRRFQRILDELIDEVETLIRDSAPGAAKALALEARTLITTHPDVEENGTARAIKLIYCAAAGNIYVNPKQPETGMFGKRLHDLPNNLRHEYLQFLYGKLNSYFTQAQQADIGECLASITDITLNKETDLEYSDFANFRHVLKKELNVLNVKLPPSD